MSNFKFVPSEMVVDHVEYYAMKSAALTTVGGEVPTEFELAAAGPVIMGVPERGIVAASVDDGARRLATFTSLRGWAPGAEQIRYPGDAILSQVRPDIVAVGKVALHLPDGYGDMVVDYGDRDPDAPRWQIRIHSGIMPALDLGDVAAQQFTALLNDANAQPDDGSARTRKIGPPRDVRLFVPAPGSQRLVKPAYQRDGVPYAVNAADGAPLTVATIESLRHIEYKADVGRGMSEALGNMARPRANIWLDGEEPYVEDYIDALRFGSGGETSAELVALGACVRCVATGVHPQTAERSSLFLAMLKNRRLVSMVTGEAGAVFAVNYAPILEGDQTAVIRQGDLVDVALRQDSLVTERKGKEQS